jgi:rhodanese-related sulfurtransferase
MMNRFQYFVRLLKRAMAYTILTALTVILVPGLAQANEIIRITPEQAFGLIQREKGNPDFVILDIRTPTEFNRGHIADAILINYYSQGFLDEINTLDRDNIYLMYCESAVRTSSTYRTIKKLGFKTFYMMIPGMQGWRTNGLPIVK